MGSNTSPARVFKGKKLPGHMGVDNTTIQNLEVVRVDAERNLILVKGAVPGPRGDCLLLRIRLNPVNNNVKGGNNNAKG